MTTKGCGCLRRTQPPEQQPSSWRWRAWAKKSDENELSNSASDFASSLAAAETEIRSADRLPASVWIVMAAGAAERFAYYCLASPLQNYIQNDRQSGPVHGALGLGQQTATTLINVFLLLQFVGPMPLAWLTDTRLGRLKMLMISLTMYQCGTLILLLTSLPISVERGAGLPGLIVAMILIALGVAGVKTSLPPLLIDQYTRSNPRVLKVQKGGKTVVSDRTMTVEFITNAFFWFTNIAALSSLASTMVEKAVDFWASFLIGQVSLMVTVALVYLWRNRFIQHAVQGSVLPLAIKALLCAFRYRFNLSAAAPAAQLAGRGKPVPWDDKVLEDLRSALIVGRVLLCSAPFYLAYIQISHNLISQAGQMQLPSHLPNDTMQIWNPVACIVLGPLIQRALFPFLRRRLGLAFGPVARIAVACGVMGLAMGYAAVLQHFVYSRGPCYDHPGACPEATVVVGMDSAVRLSTRLSTRSTETVGNNISVWIQTPVWFILAAAEVLGFTAISEIAYEHAPRTMKSVVQAATQVTAGLATVLGMALSPLTRDPLLVVMYSLISGLTVCVTVPFWWFLRDVDQKERMGVGREEQGDEEGRSSDESGDGGGSVMGTRDQRQHQGEVRVGGDEEKEVR